MVAAAAGTLAAPWQRPIRRVGLLARNPAWPVVALLGGYPIWWALGIADFAWQLFAIPMAVKLVSWHVTRSRKIRVPAGFGIWVLFLVISAVGILGITLAAPGTVYSALSHRVLSFINRESDYVAVTVLLLYAANLTEDELPRRRFAKILGLLGLITVAGGLAGMILPHLQFKSPLLLLMPHSVQANPFIQASMRPGLAQVQNILGSASGRPKAPFDYTNFWGECLTFLAPFIIIGWWQHGSRRQRQLAAGALVAGLAPLLYSLNRGAWIGVGVSVVYVAIRLALRGHSRLLIGLCLAIVAGVILVLATPLQSVITGRLHNGKSNDLRANLNSLAVQGALASPVIGYGDTRQQQGSPQSIAVGPSQNCPLCGQLAVGSTGQLWLVLICSGLVGALLYCGFFAYAVWWYRHDASPYGQAGVLVILLGFVYMLFYSAPGAPLGLTMAIYALMWKNDIYQRQRQQAAKPAPATWAKPELARQRALAAPR
jgi:O-Antigen ligase